MLRHILKPFRLLFIVLQALRVGALGLILVLSLALNLAPPTLAEVEMLDLDPNTSGLDDSLFAHRVAKGVVRLESDTVYETLARHIDPDVPVDQVKRVIGQFADGTLTFPARPETAEPAQTATVEAEPPARGFVRSQVAPSASNSILAPRTNDAKFVTARTN